MARLRNRIRKADYFSDSELLRWPRDKRTTYSGLWALAEDSGCLEDDPFNWKLLLWPSPLDSDITVELLEQWRDEYVEAGKLIPYVVAGERYFFILTFHQHESPRNPQAPDLPLPPWIECDSNAHKRGDGTVVRTRYSVLTAMLPSPYSDSTVTVSPPPSRPVPSRPDQTGKRKGGVDEPPVENEPPRKASASSAKKEQNPIPLHAFSHAVAAIIPDISTRASVMAGEDSDLHRQLQRLLRHVESLTRDRLGEFAGADLDERIVRAQRWALEDLKGADNPAAVINERLRRRDANDLLSDAHVEELRKRHRATRKKDSDADGLEKLAVSVRGEST